MTKEFVTYNQALALKELGFDEPCLAFWNGKNTDTFYFNNIRDASGDYVPFQKHDRLKWFGAPLYQQAFRWFRDVHELEGVPQKADSFSWFKFCIWKYTSNGKHRVNDAFDFEHKTYEEAESACLDKLIEIVKHEDTTR